MELNDIYFFSDEKATIIDDQMIINKFEKVFIFEKFEMELLKMFDGGKKFEKILINLREKYKNSLNEEEFILFVDDMISKGVLEKIE